MTRTGECACEQGWDQIQTNLQEWSWAGEQALSSRQLNSRGFPLIFLKEIFNKVQMSYSFSLLFCVFISFNDNVKMIPSTIKPTATIMTNAMAS